MQCTLIMEEHFEKKKRCNYYLRKFKYISYLV